MSHSNNPSDGAESAAFYTYDGAVPDEPGKLLRKEPLPAANGLPATGEQWRILYTSTEGRTNHGQVVTSGAVFCPQGRAPTGGWPIMAWTHGTVGVDDRCAPSRTPRTERDVEYLDAWLRQGFVVVATDYQGLGTEGPHLYLNTRPEAYAALDSVRAVLSGMKDVSNRVIIVGQSQGGSAAFAAAAYAPTYAPDVHVLGTVATGTPDPTYSGPSPFKPDEVNPTLAYVMYGGLTAQVLDPSIRSEQMFTAKALPLYRKARITCIHQLEDEIREEGLTLANSVKPSGIALAKRVLGERLLYPTLKLEQPLFMGTGSVDKDVATMGQLQLAKAACAAGTLVQHHLYEGLDHSQTVNASLADSIPFVKKLLAGEPVASTCATGPIVER